MTKEQEALQRIRLVLEDSEPWARNFLQTPPPHLVDLERMACSILNALEVSWAAGIVLAVFISYAVAGSSISTHSAPQTRQCHL